MVEDITDDYKRLLRTKPLVEENNDFCYWSKESLHLRRMSENCIKNYDDHPHSSENFKKNNLRFNMENLFLVSVLLLFEHNLFTNC